MRKFNQEKYTVLHYVYLPYVDMDGRTIDIDHIVVSVYGIFVIGVQNLKGRLSGTIYNKGRVVDSACRQSGVSGSKPGA